MTSVKSYVTAFPFNVKEVCCMRVSAGWCRLLALAMFACISTTVAAKGRWLLSHTPTHIFQGCPGIQIIDPLITQAVPAFYLFSSVLIHERDCTCPKALFPAKGTTPRIHQVPKVPPACGSFIQRQFHGFGNPTKTYRGTNRVSTVCWNSQSLPLSPSYQHINIFQLWNKR